MKYLIRIALWLIAIAIIGRLAFGQVPQQAQASALAVPTPPKHVTLSGFKYAGAVVVVQCKLVYGVLFIDKDTTIEPMHLIKDMSPGKLLRIITEANPDNIWKVETPCPSDQGT